MCSSYNSSNRLSEVNQKLKDIDVSIIKTNQ